jgi:OOP family OmpA-OmpF porin
MSPFLKFLIGFAAVLVMGWAWHGPVGNGQKLIDRLEAEARAQVAASEVPGVEVRLGRDPLSRAATLSGPADKFQREGMGQFPGLNDRIAAIEGISSLEWANPPPPATEGNR